MIGVWFVGFAMGAITVSGTIYALCTERRGNLR